MILFQFYRWENRGSERFTGSSTRKPRHLTRCHTIYDWQAPCLAATAECHLPARLWRRWSLWGLVSRLTLTGQERLELRWMDYSASQQQLIFLKRSDFLRAVLGLQKNGNKAQSSHRSSLLPALFKKLASCVNVVHLLQLIKQYRHTAINSSPHVRACS